MAGRVLPLGNKPPGFQHAKLRKDGGKPTARGRLLLSRRKVSQVQAPKSGTPPGVRSVIVKTKKGSVAVKPLGQAEIQKAQGAEAVHAQVKARMHQAIGPRKGLFGTKHGDSGRPPYLPGLQKAVVVQPLTSPYKSRFTFGAPKF